MKTWMVIICLVCFLLISACSDQETPAAETPVSTEVSATPTETIPEEIDVPAGEIEISPTTIESILDIQWQWIGLVEVEPQVLLMIPNPENYNLVLRADGTFNFQADCNVGSGTYSVDGSSLSLVLGPVTLAACGPDSLHDEYLVYLANVISFGMDDDALVLVSNAGNAQLSFENGGQVEPLPEEPEECSGIYMDSWVLDTLDLPYSWQANCVPATPYEESQLQEATGLPEHVQINFGVTDPTARQPGDPIIYVIPVQAYEQLWAGNNNQTIINAVDELQKLLIDRADPFPADGIPVLPPEEVSGTLDLIVQGEYLTTALGSGLRFVGRFAQEPAPVVSDDPQLLYIFEGFTSDGQYLISFTYPVTTDQIPASTDIPEGEIARVSTEYEAYLEEKTEQLNSLNASDWVPDLTTLDEVIASLSFEYVEFAVDQQATTPQLINLNWQWTEWIDVEDGQTLIGNPEQYVIIFQNDGSIDILADCNFGNGTYALDGNAMDISIDAMTEIECNEGSLSEQFVTLLDQVSDYQLTIPKLTLDLEEEAGSIGFANRGQALIPALPGEGVPTATTIEPVNVRRGPGTAYQSYGIVPAGTIFEVIGIGQDGEWWVVRLPTDIAPDGQGWISASYVETENTESVPVIAPPPLDGDTTPGEDTPLATAIEPINVRGGPSTDYPSYGIAPRGATAVVIGKSVDGLWWVVQISTDIASDGRGWVASAYVQVENADDVPVIEAPPLP